MQGIKSYLLLTMIFFMLFTTSIQAQEEFAPIDGSSSHTPDIAESDNDFSWQPVEDNLYTVTTTVPITINPFSPSFVFLTDNAEKESEFQAWHNDKDDGICTSAHTVVWDIGKDELYSFDYTSGTPYYLDVAMDLNLRYDATEAFQQSDDDYAYSCYTVKGRFRYAGVLGITTYKTTNSFVVKIYNNVPQTETPPTPTETTLTQPAENKLYTFTTGTPSTNPTYTYSTPDNPRQSEFQAWYNNNDDGACDSAHTTTWDALYEDSTDFTWTSGVAYTLDLDEWLTYDPENSDQASDSNYAHSCYTVKGRFRYNIVGYDTTNSILVKVYSDAESAEFADDDVGDKDISITTQPDQGAEFVFTDTKGTATNSIATFIATHSEGNTPSSESMFEAWFDAGSSGEACVEPQYVDNEVKDYLKVFTWEYGVPFSLDLDNWLSFDSEHSHDSDQHDFDHTCYTVIASFKLDELIDEKQESNAFTVQIFATNETTSESLLTELLPVPIAPILLGIFVTAFVAARKPRVDEEIVQ